MKFDPQHIATAKKNVYSQFGEDGVISAIFDKVGVEKKWVLEVGAADGLFFSNSRQWVEKGWNAVLIESDAEQYAKLKENCKKYKRCHIFHATVGPDNTLDDFLDKAGAPKDIDLLCIDIDGQDCHVFNAMVRHAARVVCLEYNPVGDPDFMPTLGGKGQAGFNVIDKIIAGHGFHSRFKTESNIIAVRDDVAEIVFAASADQPIRLNLGGGINPIQGYTNLDRTHGDECFPLSVADESVDEIRASHLLEHFPQQTTLEVVKHWASKLKPGGIMKIAVPDFKEISRVYGDPETKPEMRAMCGQFLMGGQTNSDDFHKSIFDAETLEYVLRQAGLCRIEAWGHTDKDCSAMPISLNLCGVKPTEEQKKPQKLMGIMSTGRLMFSTNAACAATAFHEIGVPYQIATGVFWDQTLTRLFENALNLDADLIITTDYDTYYKPNHLKKLLSLMAEYPEVDAIIPLQTKREEARLLIGKSCPEGQDHIVVSIEEFQKPLFPIETGHFGLTVFRASALRKMQQPWFLGVPGDDGRWEDNRKDPDIYFWHKWKEAGNNAFLATQVAVGHLQLLCTFPGPLETQWAPVHVYVNDLDKEGIPQNCRM